VLVLFCYTKRVPPAWDAAKEYAPDAEFIDTSDSIYAYPEAVAFHWNSGEDLVVIEDDKVITSGVLPSFASCDEPWCVYRYMTYPEPYTRWIDIGLGCTKFSAEAQSWFGPEDFLVPDHPDWGRCHDCDGKGCWRFLDSRIDVNFWKRDVRSHIHGDVEHPHPYPDDWGETTGKYMDGGPVVVAGVIRPVRR
jgi:hypothetical protein